MTATTTKKPQRRKPPRPRLKPVPLDPALYASLPKGREIALTIGARLYMSDKPCSQGHRAPRRTGNGSCIACARTAPKARQSLAKAEAVTASKPQPQPPAPAPAAKATPAARNTTDSDAFEHPQPQPTQPRHQPLGDAIAAALAALK